MACETVEVAVVIRMLYCCSKVQQQQWTAENSLQLYCITSVKTQDVIGVVL